MKIVGIILLSILCILIGLILVVMFIPIHYDVKASARESVLSAKIYVHWLLRSIRLRGDYRDGQMDSKLWILCFGRSLNGGPKEEEKGTAPSRGPEEAADSADAGDVADSRDSADSGGSADSRDSEDSTDTGEESQAAKGKHFSLRERWNSFCAKWKDLKHNIRKYKRTLEDPGSRAAVSHLKEEIIRLLKYVMPDKMKLQGSFSTGSPDTTGELLGILAMFPMGYQNRWKIYPDFESDVAYVEGDARLLGKIFVFQLVGILIRIWMDQDCRRLYHRLSK